jgi:ABC-type transport system involved in multi-copper enzyme maturation permease subunit
LFIGPVFTREFVVTPRRPRLYLYRTVYATALLVLMCTAWLLLAGTQVVRNVGDMAKFGAALFPVLAQLQLLLMVFFSALLSASAVAHEKDKGTLLLLLLTRLTNRELVLGKLLASLLNVLVMLATALPIFMLVVLLGGVSFAQVFRVFAVTLVAALVAGSLGSTFALWREKTFQTLAMTAMALVLWLVIGAPLYAGWPNESLLGVSSTWWAAALSPLTAVIAASAPATASGETLAGLQATSWFVCIGAALIVLLNGLAILLVRVWNPSREVRIRAVGGELQESIWGAHHDAALAAGETAAANVSSATQAEAARAGHVDARLRTGNVSHAESREVWDNPILWREVCTWAYGRKVIAIRLAYLATFALAAVALHYSLGTVSSDIALMNELPVGSAPLMPLMFVSLVMINALAVTSVSGERDGGALDLLLATDLTSKEFVFGKLAGVLWVAKEMVILPMLLCVYLWWRGGITLENLVYLLGGLSVMIVFVAMLGLHCGMIYANSRTSIAVSLGTVFFLFLGVVTTVLLMISFSGSFQVQLAPFLAFILGGGVGLYVALGIRNPSPAIAAAALCVPFATFYAIISFRLDMPLAVFLVMSAAYGFTTAAMLIPALYEFDVAMGRTTGNE